MSRRIMMGRYPGIGSGAGLRVAQPGRDAASGNPADLTFDSDWPAVLPLLQKGTFSIGGGGSTTIGFPDPGYIPFVAFLVRGGATIDNGTAYTPVVPIGQWVAYQNLNYDGGNSWLKLRAQSNALLATYDLYVPSGSSQGWPGSFDVAYAVYRLRAS